MRVDVLTEVVVEWIEVGALTWVTTEALDSLFSPCLSNEARSSAERSLWLFDVSLMLPRLLSDLVA